MTSIVKLDQFYGGELSRPYLVMGDDGKPLQGRVDKPSANAPLLEWAQKVPVEAGGALQKPHSYEGKVPKARNEFAIFCDMQRAEILADNPNLLVEPDAKAFRVAASLFYSEKLTDEERRRFRDMAAAERKSVDDAIDALKASDPKFCEFLEKEAAYKKAKGAIISAQKMASGPLWKVTRSINRAANETAKETKKAAPTTDKKKRRKHPKVPEALKLKYTQRPTKRYEVRSKAYTAKRAAQVVENEAERPQKKQKKQPAPAPAAAPAPVVSPKTRRGMAAARERGEYSDEYALPDLLQEMRQTRSQAAAAAAAPSPPPAKKRNRRK